MSIIIKNSLIPADYFISSYLAIKLGLKENYFKVAYKKNYDLNIEMRMEHYKFLFVKPPKDVIDRLNELYICIKITPDEVDNYEFVYKLSKNCLIGFWK